eukprot:TRINITY_DN20890_c0_g1_i1.p1 TRINITY_DN20890_c0_g1~~TRINITY_DN20890_c0_g1_i1.p1  ORF type:complete len:429 (-),score=92.48 TRINITY_DN20890_c0_g1_i1:164-1324(-)
MASSSPVEPDTTCQAFAQWLTELRARNARTLQEMLSEMAIIRDGITSNNVELNDFKRHSTGVSTSMQAQVTDLREKLTAAFSEITSLVKAKTQYDNEMMQDIGSLQQDLSSKCQELEALKRGYTTAHSSLQKTLLQIQNHLQVTGAEVQQAKAACERVQGDMTGRFSEIDSNLRAIEDELNAGNAETRNRMLQLQEDIARISEAIANVTSEFDEHKRLTNTTQNKLQSAVWGYEEDTKRQQQGSQLGMAGRPGMSSSVDLPLPQPPQSQLQPSAQKQHTEPIAGAPMMMAGAGRQASPPTTYANSVITKQPQVMQVQPMQQVRAGSANLPTMMQSAASSAMLQAAIPTRSSVMLTTQTLSPMRDRPGTADARPPQALQSVMYRAVR